MDANSKLDAANVLERLNAELAQLKSSNPEAYEKLLEVLDTQLKKLNTSLAEVLATS